MKTALEFLSEISRELDSDIEDGMTQKYRGLATTRDPVKFNCTDIAKRIAGLLLQEDRQPKVVRFGRQNPGSLYFLDRMFPVKYPGHKGFSYHDVCLCGGMIWCPLTGKPIPVEEYSATVFGQEFQMSEHTVINQKILEGKI